MAAIQQGFTHLIYTGVPSIPTPAHISTIMSTGSTTPTSTIKLQGFEAIVYVEELDILNKPSSGTWQGSNGNLLECRTVVESSDVEGRISTREGIVNEDCATSKLYPTVRRRQASGLISMLHVISLHSSSSSISPWRKVEHADTPLPCPISTPPGNIPPSPSSFVWPAIPFSFGPFRGEATAYSRSLLFRWGRRT